MITESIHVLLYLYDIVCTIVDCHTIIEVELVVVEQVHRCPVPAGGAL